MSMTKIATVTVGAGGASSIDFTSISGAFTDLMVVYSGNGSVATPKVRFNGSSSAIYSERLLYGTGSSAASANRSSQTDFDWLALHNLSGGSIFGNSTIYIPNYAGNTNKSVSSDSVSEANAIAANQYLDAGLWASTAAITSISIYVNSGVINQYSTATLYGITKGSLAGVTVS